MRTANLGIYSGVPAPPLVPRPVQLVALSATAVTTSNSTTETNVFSISQQAVSANCAYVLTAWGLILNNSGASVNYQFRGKIGSTTVWTPGQISAATGGANRFWRCDFVIGIQGARTAQTTQQSLRVSGIVTGSQTAIRDDFYIGHGTGSATEDMNSAKTVALSIQMGTANANASFTISGFTFEEFQL